MGVGLGIGRGVGLVPWMMDPGPGKGMSLRIRRVCEDAFKSPFNPCQPGRSKLLVGHVDYRHIKGCGGAAYGSNECVTIISDKAAREVVAMLSSGIRWCG